MSSFALPRVLLEEWMRMYYFAVDVDIGSSGVENYSLGDLRARLGFPLAELDAVMLRDSETLGGIELRRAIADRWCGGADRADHVLVTHGSSEGLFLVMTSLLEAGDRVVVLDPCYPQHFSIGAALGCRFERWPLRFDNGFRPAMADARRLIVPGTRMVIVNFPHNPTGATLEPAEQEELLRLVEHTGAYLVWDGAFSELTYERPPLPEPALRSPRVLSLGTMSKAYGLPGLRVGWCLAAPEVLERLALTRDHVTLHLSPLVELVARRAIEGADRLLAPRREQARRNRKLLAAWIEAQDGAVEWVPPAGGVCAFVRLPGIDDVEAFCHRLAREHRVLLIPGSCFDHPQHARLGFGDSTASFRAGLSTLARALRAAATPACEAVALRLGDTVQ